MNIKFLITSSEPSSTFMDYLSSKGLPYQQISSENLNSIHLIQDSKLILKGNLEWSDLKAKEPFDSLQVLTETNKIFKEDQTLQKLIY